MWPINANEFKIKNTECEKLLGIKVYCGRKFENYLDSVIEKASNEIMLCLELHHVWICQKRKCWWILSLSRN